MDYLFNLLTWLVLSLPNTLHEANIRLCSSWRLVNGSLRSTTISITFTLASYRFCFISTVASWLRLVDRSTVCSLFILFLITFTFYWTPGLLNCASSFTFIFSIMAKSQVPLCRLSAIDLYCWFQSPKFSSKYPKPFKRHCWSHEWYSTILLFGFIDNLRYLSNSMHLFRYCLVLSEILSVKWDLFFNIPLI